MHDVFQRHYAEDCTTRFPHIPSIPITLPVDHQTLADTCFQARYHSIYMQLQRDDVIATAVALLQAVVELQSDPEVQMIQDAAEQTSNTTTRKFFLKRNYSGESTMATMSFVLVVGASL